MDKELQEAIAEILYDAEKHERINKSIAGNIIEWETLRDFQKRLWRSRVETVVTAHHGLTKTRYVALSDEEIAFRVDECNAQLQAGMEQE